MVHDIDSELGKGPALRPAARLCHLILIECLGGGFQGIGLFASDAPTGGEALGVKFMVEGEWREVMKIPGAAGIPVMAHLRSMCDVDPVHHPQQRGAFRVRTSGMEASVAVRFNQTATGFEEAELEVTPSPPAADE